MRDHLTILTGAPGTGKTAILARLGPGIRRVTEPAREVLAEHRAQGGHSALESTDFVPLLLRRSIEKYRAVVEHSGPVVFDRGVPDCVAYARHLGTDPAAGVGAAARYRYRREVLLLRPWEEIYTTDDERRMTFEHTLAFQRHIEEVFREIGYLLVEVPFAPIEQRVAFVEEFVSGQP